MVNEGLYQRLEKEVKELVNKFDLFEITKKNQDIEDDLGYCTISLQSCITCLEELDCMGIGLSIRTPETAVADPSRLQVVDVYPAYYTVNSFLELALFNLI